MPFAGTWTPIAQRVFLTYHKCSEGWAYADAGSRGDFRAGGHPIDGYSAGGSGGDVACEAIAAVGQQRSWGQA